MSDICFVVTCRGRREHLQQSLPLLAAQPGTSCVVVDYDCPEGTGDWVEAAFPQVKLVRVGSRPRFELAQARNLGALAADAPWLCFVDADALVAPGFAQAVRPLLRRGQYYRAQPKKENATGMCICHRDDFEAVGRYDTVLQGWGMEDRDLYFRLEMAGIQQAAFPSSFIDMIPHPDEMRVAHYDVKDNRLNSTLNLMYCRMKWDLTRLNGRVLNEAYRAELYDKISRGVQEALGRAGTMEVSIPVLSQSSLSGARIEATLVYKLNPPATDPE